MIILISILLCLATVWIIPGVMAWIVIGSPLRYKYSQRIIFSFPLLLISKSYYQFYLQERSKELEEDSLQRDADYKKHWEATIARWNEEERNKSK